MFSADLVSPCVRKRPEGASSRGEKNDILYANTARVFREKKWLKMLCTARVRRPVAFKCFHHKK